MFLMVENVQVPIRIGNRGRFTGAATKEEVMKAQAVNVSSLFCSVISIPFGSLGFIPHAPA
jgi:hypothetical protein